MRSEHEVIFIRREESSQATDAALVVLRYRASSILQVCFGYLLPFRHGNTNQSLEKGLLEEASALGATP